jgi:hypothetical protein
MAWDLDDLDDAFSGFSGDCDTSGTAGNLRSPSPRAAAAVAGAATSLQPGQRQQLPRQTRTHQSGQSAGQGESQQLEHRVQQLLRRTGHYPIGPHLQELRREQEAFGAM